jgi:hypothetical protein
LSGKEANSRQKLKKDPPNFLMTQGHPRHFFQTEKKEGCGSSCKFAIILLVEAKVEICRTYYLLPDEIEMMAAPYRT